MEFEIAIDEAKPDAVSRIHPTVRTTNKLPEFARFMCVYNFKPSCRANRLGRAIQ